MYEDHCRQNGQPTSHAFAKELLAGFASAEVDRLIETKVGLRRIQDELTSQGLDSIDREKGWSMSGSIADL